MRGTELHGSATIGRGSCIFLAPYVQERLLRIGFTMAIDLIT
jgi:hypothetical protein